MMENSGKIFFGEDNSPQWYVALGNRWEGPLTVEDIYGKIQTFQIGWAHYVWRRGQTEWTRICDTKAFQSALPEQPTRATQKSILETVESPSESNPVGWYLYYNDSQFGPFSQTEIQRFLSVGKINSQVHVWRQGMRGWERLEEIEVFRTSVSVSGKLENQTQIKASQRNKNRPIKQTKPEMRDQRGAPRRPLVAKILMADEQSVIVGVCRDISVGGCQVLTQRLPGKVGAKLKMNISPSTDESGKTIEACVAQGVIVRILEDGRGFSFRFERLSSKSKQAIESYLKSST